MKKCLLCITFIFTGLCCLNAQQWLDRLKKAAENVTEKTTEKAGEGTGALEDLTKKLAEKAGIDTKPLEAITGAVATIAESKKAADNLTQENKYYLGRAVAANIAGQYKIYKNPAIEAYLNKICNAIVINSPSLPEEEDLYNGYHVAILDTEEINAFATPGGHIFVTRGLIACALNEDALASVIAHEIAHIQKEHALTAIRNARYANAAISGALAGLNAAGLDANITELTSVLDDSVNEVITTLFVNGFSQPQEFDADTTALSLLASAGYQPSALLEMLGALKQRQRGTQGFGKTHPTPDARIANVNKNIGKYRVQDTRTFRAARYGTISR